MLVGNQALDDGVVGMKKNGRRLVISPPASAYGADGKAGKVPPGAIVVFEMELVRVSIFTF